jgi:16S rRNA (uracil1498-N3)-methyltransferase
MTIVMHRFFVSPEAISGSQISIAGDQARQISRVLRLKHADRIIVLDNTGYEYEMEIDEVATDLVGGRIVKKGKGAGEPSVSVLLYQAMMKLDKFELVLQKCVELGVTQFWPFISEHCVVREPSDSKIERWLSIVREAAEQSRRSILPPLYPPVSFELVCKSSPVPGIILWEQERSYGISQVLNSELFREAKIIRVFVGPEGGFTSAEISLARHHDIVPVSLGKRILRTETAGLVALSAIMYARGELG